MDGEENAKTYGVKDLRLLKGFGKYLKPYLGRFTFLIVLDLFVNFFFTAESYLMSLNLDVINEVLNGTRAMDEGKRLFFLYFGLDLGLLLLASIGAYLVNYDLRKIGQRVVYDLRQALFHHVLSLSRTELKKLKTGSFVTRITNDTQNLSSFFSDLLPQLVRNVFSVLFIQVLVFVRTGLFGFVFLAYLPIVFLLSLLFQKGARKYYLGEKDAVSEMNSFLSESFSGVLVVKTYHREEKMKDSFDRKNEAIYHNFLKGQDLFALFYPSMYLLQMSAVLILSALAVPEVAKGAMTVGVFYLLCTYTGQYFQPIQQIASLLNGLQSVFSSAERTLYLENMPEEKESEKGELVVPSFRGRIVFDHVSFRYPDGKEDVLHDVSFMVEPGETVAFVGPTGAGKSTILALMTRTYEPTEGRILLDGRDLREYSQSCLRKNLGVMLQDVFLFSGTVEENISLGDPSITSEDVRKASDFVMATPFIQSLPHGFKEPVKENGSNFSAGQRQLLSFARTLAFKPSLLLLDEATANIDTETEHVIQSSLRQLRKVGTLVVVAHRLSTIQDADHIFVIARGVVAEEGTHQELLKRKGTYYNLYRLQNLEENLSSPREEEHA